MRECKLADVLSNNMIQFVFRLDSNAIQHIRVEMHTGYLRYVKWK